MRQYVILGLAAVILACSLVALADSLEKPVTPPSDSDQLDALETLEIKSLSSGRITVTSSDGTHVLECDALSLDLLENGASKIRARGTVVL